MATKKAAAPKVLTTRLIKVVCKNRACGFNCRITRKWIDEVGAPHCPAHGKMRVMGADVELQKPLFKQGQGK
jgi:hypothetical protein